ncbi:MAG: HNH endonuclease [Synechococcaceae cyanobacterium]
MKDRAHRCARGRCECCGAHEHQRALEVDHVIPRNQGGPTDFRVSSVNTGRFWVSPDQAIRSSPPQ